MRPANPREIVFRLLCACEQQRAAADDLLRAALEKSGMPARDRALVTELFYGCLRQRRALDWLAARKAAHTPKPRAAALARLGLYQLFFLDKVPAHAAVHSTVELAKHHLSASEAGFLNAVLRAALRERAALASALQQQSLPVRFSHPDWLVERWLARHGEADTQALLEWNNKPPALYARVNTLKTGAAALAEKLRAGGVETEPWTASGQQQVRGSVLRVRSAVPVEQMPGFGEGEFYLQDPSTLLAVELLDPKPGERVLDACAAPGGKTTYIAELMGDRGEVVAEDSSAERLKLVVANCARLGIRCVTIQRSRPPGPGETWFDRALLDVPCSNTGVFRRRVDARWRLQPRAIPRLAAEQLKLLTAVSARIKRGGVLVYSTCSLEPEENRGVVDDFLKVNPSYALERCVESFPPRDQMDGAFAAQLVRVKL
ncbi:MAG: 16S rRNA (cytosine(967)-C(5))-methyltransferase RsmB [Verrucomicrobiae bacterium]|nr:16S rRNA (cytosine(967)-C(5))-methyltransferase RsmB [Verrucomicrobiae bacterium]